jgi:glycosyltransferase involved in cell wall biosynthesis
MHIASFIKTIRQYDVIHIQYAPVLYLFYLYPVFLLKKAGTKVILTVHEDGFDQPLSFIFKPFARHYFSLADQLIFHSKTKVISRFKDKAIVIPLGCAYYSQYKPDFKKGHNLFLPGFINPWKGHMTAIKAVKQLSLTFPDIHLLIEGFPHNRAYAKQIEKYIHQEKLKKHVILKYKWTSQTVLEKNLHDCDVVILPYTHANMSGVITWAMSLQKPTVVSDLPVFREICEDAVLYADIDDVEMFADMVEQLLKDTQLQQQLSRQMKAKSQEYSWQNIANQTITHCYT